MENKLSDEIIEYLKIKPKNNQISKVLFEKMNHLIITGKLPVGFTFPNENDMCKMLNIGRSTIREAYTALSVLGFITRTKAGTKVNDMSDMIHFAPFSATLNTSDRNDLLEFRFMLEAEIARYAANRATKEEITKLGEANEKMKIYIHNDSNKFAYYDAQFHMGIAYASHNHLLISTMIAAREAIENGIRKAAMNAANQKNNVLEVAIHLHQKLIEAIEKGDAQTASSIMKEHIAYVNATVRYI